MCSDEAVTFITGNVGVRADAPRSRLSDTATKPKGFIRIRGTRYWRGTLLFFPKNTHLSADVDGNGIVNILDLVRIATRLGRTGPDAADVNGDGVVNIHDIVLAAALMGTEAAAPSAFAGIGAGHRHLPLRPEDIQLWLTQIQSVDLYDPTFQRGVIVLKHLMEALTPKKTALLPNYPNPFNPETWIPYQLSEPADVTLTIYTADGQLIRTLSLGHQPAGVYQNRSRAAHWDGRNELGELVASGIYFYTLRVSGEFTATRKLLIQK